MDLRISERIGRHLRSNVVAYLALFVALTFGSALATTKAPKNSVVSKSIKNGQVMTADIGDGQVTGQDIGDGQVTGQDIGDGQVTGQEVDESTLSGVPLPPCPSDQILKSTGSGYACANDVDTDTDTNSGGTVTSVVAGNGISGGGALGAVTLDLDACPAGDILRSTGASYACGDVYKSAGAVSSGATPSVQGGVSFLRLNHSSPTAITDLLSDQVEGQVVTLQADKANPTINDGGNFQLAGNWVPDQFDTLTVVFVAFGANHMWVEVARSSN